MMRRQPYDVVIADWNMQPMTGFKLLRIVRADKDLASTKFLIMTARTDRHGCPGVDICRTGCSLLWCWGSLERLRTLVISDGSGCKVTREVGLEAPEVDDPGARPPAGLPRERRLPRMLIGEPGGVGLKASGLPPHHSAGGFQWHDLAGSSRRRAGRRLAVRRERTLGLSDEVAQGVETRPEHDCCHRVLVGPQRVLAVTGRHGGQPSGRHGSGRRVRHRRGAHQPSAAWRRRRQSAPRRCTAADGPARQGPGWRGRGCS